MKRFHWIIVGLRVVICCDSLLAPSAAAVTDSPGELILISTAADQLPLITRRAGTVPNPGGRLKPQMFTNVEIKAGLGRRLAVPDDAVLDTGVRQIVYVDKGEGVFEPREVKLGLGADGYREVLSGLKAGEKVARSATFLIDSEAQLKGVR